jgi:hypothetical protein
MTSGCFRSCEGGSPSENERTVNDSQQVHHDHLWALQVNSSGGPDEQMSFSVSDLTEALAILHAAMAWNLRPSRWAEVDRALLAMAGALASGDNRSLLAGITTLELLSPVRQGSRAAILPAPEEVRSHLLAAISAIEQLKAPNRDARRIFPVTIYLTDGSIHDQVELAVEQLLRLAGLRIIERGEPVAGSWYRRLSATLDAAARSSKGQEAILSAAHAADARFFLRQDAELTTLLLQNLGPVIIALQPTKDAVVRAGALLIVKADWVVAVHQLTPRQQLMLDHAPDLETAPHQVLKALGIAGAESGSAIQGAAPGRDGGVDPRPE